MRPISRHWLELPSAGLWVRAFRTGREDVAFWKHLFESFEDVAVVRTAANEGPDAIVALVATRDFVEEAESVLDDVVRRGAPRVVATALPAHCREDWFLTEWSRPGERRVD